jgi:hypothetical protein
LLNNKNLNMEVLHVGWVQITMETPRCMITTATGVGQAREGANKALRMVACMVAAMVEVIIRLASIRILDRLCRETMTMMICGDRSARGYLPGWLRAFSFDFEA